MFGPPNPPHVVQDFLQDPVSRCLGLALAKVEDIHTPMVRPRSIHQIQQASTSGWPIPAAVPIWAIRCGGYLLLRTEAPYIVMYMKHYLYSINYLHRIMLELWTAIKRG